MALIQINSQPIHRSLCRCLCYISDSGIIGDNAPLGWLYQRGIDVAGAVDWLCSALYNKPQTLPTMRHDHHGDRNDLLWHAVTRACFPDQFAVLTQMVRLSAPENVVRTHQKQCVCAELVSYGKVKHNRSRHCSIKGEPLCKWYCSCWTIPTC